MADISVNAVDRWQVHVLRLTMGALAGFTSTLVKYWSHDHPVVVELIRQHQNAAVRDFLSGYAIGLGVLMFLGAISAWVVREYDFRKMFWVGLSAPSLLAAAIPPVAQANGITAKTSLTMDVAPISVAYAADNPQPDCIGDDFFTKGVKTFFGIPSEKSDKYTVIVGSYKEQAAAEAKAKQVNQEDSSLKARVGKRSCTSEYYPVIVGDTSVSADDAKKTLGRVLNLNSVGSDAYLSPGPR